ncbi:MAG TPA: Crp/Fnr family transcriptional regulator, partial [Polyangiaceae bacterium]
MQRSLQKWVVLPTDAWSDFARLFRSGDYEAGQQLVLPGAPLGDLFFVVEGLLRFYYIDGGGRQWNKSFVGGGTFAGALSSYVLGLPARYAIEALEPTQVLVARWVEVDAAYDRHPAIERLGRRFAEWLAVRKELREQAFLELDAAKRYQVFLEEHAELATRIPNYHIASYLGVTEVTLSRIRSRLAARRQVGAAAPRGDT